MLIGIFFFHFNSNILGNGCGFQLKSCFAHTSMVSSNLLVNKYILGVSFQRGAEEEWRPSFGAKIVLLSWAISSCPFDFSWWTFTFDGL